MKTSNDACPFCSSAIKSHILMETTGFAAIYNHAPILPGHAMIITTDHKESIMELSSTELFTFVNFSRKVTNVLLRVFGGEGFDWSLQESEAAGQSVAHLHLHIIPRKRNDLEKPGDWYQLLENQRHQHIDDAGRKRLSEEEISAIVSIIKKQVS
jgi:bis(5'-adenosyl)-triphosphatase